MSKALTLGTCLVSSTGTGAAFNDKSTHFTIMNYYKKQAIKVVRLEKHMFAEQFADHTPFPFFVFYVL